jgi:hypothetical protein
MDLSHLSFDLGQLPPWAIPAIGVGCTLLVLAIGLLLVGGKSAKPQPASWYPQPIVRSPAQETQLVARPTGQRRTTVRRAGNPIDVQVTDADAQQPPVPAIVLDRSLTGIRLAVSSPHRTGAMLCVRPVTGDASLPWVQVQVKNCQRVGKGFEVGCAFRKVPPASILMLFG